jgi:hypothetical protein
MLTLLINETKPLAGLFASTTGGIGSVPDISVADEGQAVSVQTFTRTAGVITDSFVAGDVLHIGIGDGVNAPVCYIELSSASPATGTMAINTVGMVALFAATSANQLTLNVGVVRTRGGNTNTIFSAPIVIHRSVIDPDTAVPTPSILGTGVAAALKVAINTALGFVRLDASARYPALDGSQITNLAGGSLTVGTTAIASGTSGRILYDNAGVLGELPVGTGVATALAVNVGSAGAFVTTVPAVVKSNGVTSLFYTPTANTAAARGVALAAAIAACASGDEIRIGPGTFDGNITLPAGVVLRGAGEQFTTINGTITRSSPAQAYSVFDLRASDGNQPAVLTQTWAPQSSAYGSGYNALMWCHNVQLQPDATWTRLSAGRGHRLALENDYQPNDTGAVRQEFNWDLFADGAAGPNVNAARRIFHFEILNDGTRGSNYVYGNFGANGALKSETTDGTPAYLQANSTGDIFGTGSSITRNIQWNISTLPLGADTAGGNIIGGSNNFLNIEPFDQAGYVTFCSAKGSGTYIGSGTAGFFTALTAPANGTLRVTTNGSTLGTVEAATGTFTSTTSLLLGTAGSAVGNIGFRNATSGTTTLAPATGALGTGTVTLPLSGTLATLQGSNTYTGTTNTFTLPTTTGTTTASGIAVAGNSLTTGTGIYAASSSLTSGKLLDLQVSGTAAAASQTALNVATAGANGTSGITTKGAVISNTHTGTTSTNVALELTASGGTTNTALNVTAGAIVLQQSPTKYTTITPGAVGGLVFTLTTDGSNLDANYGITVPGNLTIAGNNGYAAAISATGAIKTTGAVQAGSIGWYNNGNVGFSFSGTTVSTGSSTTVLSVGATTESTTTTTGAIVTAGGLGVVKNVNIGGTLAVTGASTFTGLLTANGGITLGDAQNIAFNTTTGTKIGAATTQKLSFWNATPIVQPTTAVASATVAHAGGGTNIKTDDTFDGYTIAQVVKALRNAGLLA